MKKTVAKTPESDKRGDTVAGSVPADRFGEHHF